MPAALDAPAAPAAPALCPASSTAGLVTIPSDQPADLSAVHAVRDVPATRDVLAMSTDGNGSVLPGAATAACLFVY